MKKLLTILAITVSLTQNAHALGELMASGNILKFGEYDITAMGQSFSSGPSGSNIGVIGEMAFNKDMNLRFSASTGEYSLAAGAHIKWVPFTESKNKPNFGIITGAEFATEDSIDTLLVRMSPFVSKNFSWEHGNMEPYLGLPVGIVIVDSNDDITSQLVVGTKVKFERLEYMTFSIEGGFKIKNSFSHLALMATLQLGK